MDIAEQLLLSSREEWRARLEEHHQTRQEIWLILFKSTSGRREFPLSHAVEEALCFGWIDSTLKPIDASRYALRFLPRRKKSYWADSNKARTLRLLREGKITPAGMALLPSEVINAWEEENHPGY